MDNISKGGEKYFFFSPDQWLYFSVVYQKSYILNENLKNNSIYNYQIQNEFV